MSDGIDGIDRLGLGQGRTHGAPMPPFPAANLVDVTAEGEERPRIEEKAVAWHEAVAAHLARKRAAAADGKERGDVLTMLAAPMVERVAVAGLLLEPYSLAHAVLLEALGNPFEIGGDVTTLDIAAALMCFGERELLQGIVADLGAKRAREVLYAGPAIREVLARVTRESLPALRAWLHEQFAAVGGATVDAAEAAEEAAVVAAEKGAGGPPKK